MYGFLLSLDHLFPHQLYCLGSLYRLADVIECEYVMEIYTSIYMLLFEQKKI